MFGPGGGHQVMYFVNRRHFHLPEYSGRPNADTHPVWLISRPDYFAVGISQPDVSKWLLTLHNPRIKTQIVIFQQRQIIESVFIPTLTGDPLSLKNVWRISRSSLSSVSFATVFAPRLAGSGLSALVIASVVEKPRR